MKKAIEIVEYLVGVLGQNVLALKEFKPKTNEGRAYLDSWGDQLVKVIELLAQMQTHLQTGWQPMDTAPKDGTLIRLLIAPDDARQHPLEDSENSTPTIGFNNLKHDGEDCWRFAGWCWEQDHFTAGTGNPVGWAPFIDDANAPQSTEGTSTAA